MDKRPISDQIRRWLLVELDAWRSAGILANDQPLKILDLYETTADAANRRHSLAIFVLCSLAAAMVGLAVLLLVGYNWQELSAAAKLTIIFGSLVGLHGAGVKLRTSARPLASEIVFFGACILYGAGIWLIAQIFNIQSHYPDGIWMWAIGLLPFALYLDTLLMHIFYAGMLALWVHAEILDTHGFLLDSSPFMLSGFAVTLPILVLPGFWWAYRKRSALTVAIYAPLIAWWTVLQPFAWQWDVNPAYFVGLVGAILILIAECHPIGSRMAIPYRLYGVLVCGGVLIPMSFADFILELLRDGRGDQNLVAGLIILAIGAAAALGVVAFQRRITGKAVGAVEILRRQTLPLAIILLMGGICLWCGGFAGCCTASRHLDLVGKWSIQALVPATIANVMMIAMSLWLMGIGLHEDRAGPFSAGVLYFMLWAMIRYVDLFSGIGGMLGAASMFLMCGVGLFAVARFWMNRRKDSNVAVADNATADAATTFSGLAVSEKHRGPWLLIAGIALQLVLLVGMIGDRLMLLQSGETVSLRVVPVDPRDLFRGDYVTLSYDISQIPAAGVAGLPDRKNHYDGTWRGRTIYAVLAKDADGRHWKLDKFTVEKPTAGLFLRGTIGWGGRVAYGIESYYVQEGEGLSYERAVRDRKLSAEVVVSPNGRAALKSLAIE